MSSIPRIRFDDSLAYANGEWSPLSQLRWSVTDVGTTHGAIIVERMRTIGKQIFALADHIDRLVAGAFQLGIDCSQDIELLSRLCRELVARNASLLDQETDFGIVIVVSPGDPGIERDRRSHKTLMAHVSPIPFAQLANWYREGVSLTLSSVQNVPPECWSPSIKTRSRLQYYLADRQVSSGIALLTNIRGAITETSVANLLIVDRNECLLSPRLEDILSGVSLKTVIELAHESGLEIGYRDLFPEDVAMAKEVLMTGSTGCLWSAVNFNGKAIGDGKPGSIATELRGRWERAVGYPFSQNCEAQVR